MSGSGGVRWLKYGCFGCLGLTGAVFLVIAAVAGVAWMGMEEPQVEDRALTHDLPRSQPGALPPEAAVAEGTAGRELPIAGAGRVSLDLSHGEFSVVPGPPGSPLSVEATYDTKAFRLEESFVSPEGEPWHYTVAFRQTGQKGILATLRQMFGDSQAVVRIVLPPDAPIELDMQVEQGASEVDLGGLWLTEADVQLAQGALILRVREPLREPMRRMSIHAAMGGAEISGIGNASPREFSMDLSMGGMELDLSGAWQNDSEITIRAAMGGGEVRVPDNVVMEGAGVSAFASDQHPEVPLPTLRLTPESKLENVHVSR